MPLGFLVPAFLLAAAAVALPIYLHLRHRERRTPVRFPSLMFLARIPHRTSDRRRLTHLLLLALRAAAVVLLAIAFARPFLRDEATAAAAASSRDVMLVVDRSMSMGYTGVWAAVRDSARRILAGLGPGDRAGLVLADAAAEVAVPLTSDRARVTAALAAAEPGPGAGRLGPGLRAASRALADSAGARGEIAVLSDYQPSSVAGLEGLALPPGATLTPIRVGPEERANTAVMGVETARGANGGAEITARAVRFGGTGARSVRAVLELGGREAGAVTAALEPGAVTPIRFLVARVPAGEIRGVVRLPADGLAADNEFRFTLAAEDRTRVRVFAPSDARSPELLFLERALTIGRPPRFEVEVRRGGRVSLAGWGRGTAAIFVDRLPSGDAERRELLGFLDRGGGAILFAGARLPARRTAPAPDDPWPAATGEIVTRTESPGILGPLDRDHPALAPLLGLDGGGFAGVRFFRYRGLTAGPGGAVLARLDDGRPALVASEGGSRRTMVVAAPADGIWSDLPLHPFFLPLLQRLVDHAAGTGTERPWREVGDVFALTAAAGARVFDPAGGPIPLGDDSAAAVPLSDRGFYEVRRDAGSAEPIAVIAVNAPASESDPAHVDPREVVLAVHPDTAAGARAESAALTPADAERRQRIWRMALLAVLALLAAEVMYANLGPGRRAPGPAAASPP